MESLFLLIPLALIFIIIAVVIFFWAVDDGQFDDLEGPAHSILFDDDQQVGNKKPAPSDAHQKGTEPTSLH